MRSWTFTGSCEKRVENRVLRVREFPLAPDKFHYTPGTCGALRRSLWVLSVLLRCMSPVMMWWTAPAPSNELL